eukprot:gene27678-36490_t
MPPKQKALDKKAQAEDEKILREEAEREKREAAEWSVGVKDSKKQKDLEEKDATKRAKAAEKAALLAEEEASLSTIAKSKPTKKKGKDDFDLLNATLAQQPKTKAQKEAELKKKADEERKQKEAEARKAKEEQRRAEEEEIRKAAAKGIIINHTDSLFIPLNNRLPDEYEDDDGEGGGAFVAGTGLDSALDVMSLAVKGPSKIDEHPERRQKALYNAYYESQLSILKEDCPGLKLSQYKDRIFEMWKKAPENPKNQG